MKLDCNHSKTQMTYPTTQIEIGQVTVNRIDVCLHCLAVRYFGTYVGSDHRIHALPLRWKRSGLTDLMREIGNP